MSILFNGKDPRTHRTLLLWFRNSQNMGISIFDHPAHLSQLLMLSNSVSDDLLELLLLLLQPLLQLDQIPVYWHQLSPQAQLMLLKIVDALIQPDLNLTIPSLINTSHLFATTLLNFAKQPYTHLVDIPPHLLQMLVLLLEYFKWTTEHRQQEIQHLLDSGFVDTICHTLRYLNNLQKPINSAKDNQTSLSNHPLFRTKSDCIQILSNLASYGLHAPDVIRESGGLILILNHCIVDDLNPYIREYSILAIRYLTEHNLQNQQFISQLEAKGTVSNDVLDELKVTTELDTATGRIKINRAL
ncbi:spinocerebellar ataxia type 10 protein domain-containing protein [Gorgonomyces haynaldii]|nr:spinocerebellar ataxia type 10 protein domain-containing protein [Gorgonomyces haynaldii]